MNTLKLLLLALTLSLVSTACADDASSPPEDPDEGIPFRSEGTLAFVREGDTLIAINIEVADNDSARTRGLMGRTSLPDSSGMLFIFPTEEEQSFWMANTQLSLDMFFADADSHIVRVAKYTTPLSSKSVTSQGPAQFVVETPAGFADQHGIVEGDRVTWERE